MKQLRYTITAVLLLAVAPASAASLIGDQMDVGYRVPTVTTAYPLASPSVSPFTIGAGVETVVDVEGVTDLVVDFGADSLLLTFNTSLSSPTWQSASFNGLLFGGPGAARITGASVVSSTVAGFDNSRLLLADGNFGLNWQGLSYVDGDQIVTSFDVAAVPEPTTWAMLLVGFGAVGAVARRRGRHAARALASA